LLGTPTYPHEPKVDFPLFTKKDNVEKYLDYEIKVEQIFECHKINHERRVSLATLSFQAPVLD